MVYTKYITCSTQPNLSLQGCGPQQARPYQAPRVTDSDTDHLQPVPEDDEFDSSPDQAAMEAFGPERCERIKRLEVKLWLCHDSKAKDANIRQALIDRFGPVGTKNNPAPMFGMAGDMWAALAVAVTWWDKNVPKDAA